MNSSLFSTVRTLAFSSGPKARAGVVQDTVTLRGFRARYKVLRVLSNPTFEKSFHDP